MARANYRSAIALAPPALRPHIQLRMQTMLKKKSD
jgi:hypothetical protein